MNIRQTVISQYQQIVDHQGSKAREWAIPKEGWLRTVRKSLGMSGAQLGRRMGISRAQVAQTERGELAASVTLRSMQKAAEALGCRFVYAIVADGPVMQVVEQRAHDKARAIVEQASTHMALEAQTLSPEKIRFEIERLKQEFLRDLPADLWNDT